MKIAFDVGGVISKYPQQFFGLMRDLHNDPYNEVFVISDLHPKEKIVELLRLNNFLNICVWSRNVYSADYEKYGEACKTKLCEKLNIDILIDDHMAYLVEGDFIRLMVMPNTRYSYWAPTWKTVCESDFGRRVPND